METVSTLCTSILKKVNYKYESSKVKLKIVIETHIGKDASPALNSTAWNESIKCGIPHLTSRFCKDELGPI